MHYKSSFRMTVLLMTAGLALLAHADGGAGNLQQHTASLYTSGTLSAEQLASLKADGLTSVIDLRRPAEGLESTQNVAAELGLSYNNVPLGGKLPDTQTMAQISAIIDNAGSGKVLLHCSSGNRAGLVLATYLQQHGMRPAAALASAQAAGTRADGLQQLQDYFEQLSTVEPAASPTEQH
ncbi:MAG: sulfur transferase domain-containing protein [Gammaproteobacteria bacterium]|nr:sulfur transferase domain-containing protein [Gammaproteobacteria bacterium]